MHGFIHASNHVSTQKEYGHLIQMAQATESFKFHWWSFNNLIEFQSCHDDERLINRGNFRGQKPKGLEIFHVFWEKEKIKVLW